ncbi:hypothetical protein MBLNU230_g6917t1 [Neophaeotheca triangularis]
MEIEALEVAAIVIQFIDHGARLLSKAHKIYTAQEDVVEDAGDFEAMASRLSDLGKQAASKVALASIHRTLSHDEKELYELATSCKQKAAEVRATLDEVDLQGPRTFWKSVKAAKRASADKRKLEGQAKALERLQLQFNTRVSYLIRQATLL